MNFFEYQDQARRQTRWLVFLFILAVIAIAAVVDLALLVGFGLAGSEQGAAPFSPGSLEQNLSLLLGGAIATVCLIGLASLFKTIALRGGGGKVARELGGILVDADTRDPLKRRLVNVVEEIALASGVPVPEIYVLEQEAGINAFAAGFSPSDAAIAVTRGTLEKLTRAELQGVIAHEFSHVFNGDMRLNIRLMGALFGILLLALIGRRVLFHSHYMGRSRDSSGAAILMLAFALMLVGYIGMFFGRWIKSAVSRQREFLADASAVQFTRDPSGIAGALKKIAIYSEASYLDADTEEVGHMLFGPGQAMHVFATHPPLLKRIARIEPGFQEEDLKVVAARIQRAAARQAEVAAREQAAGGTRPPFGLDADSIIERIGNPDSGGLMVAAAVAASIPEQVGKAAHSVEWAPEVLLYALLDSHDELREKQLLIVAKVMGPDSEARVRALAGAASQLRAEQKLPLMEIALPGLRRHPPQKIQSVLKAVDGVIRVDGEIDVFEYLMARLISRYLWEAMNPHRVRTAGRKSLVRLQAETLAVLAIMAWHGHPGQQDACRSAYDAGVQAAFAGEVEQMPDTGNWIEALDHALNRLDDLSPPEKQKLVNALVAVVTCDQQLVAEELELMRAICAALHVPIPMMTGPDPSG